MASLIKYEIMKQSCLHPTAQPFVLVAWPIRFQDDMSNEFLLIK